ncbi:hypothetical protein [Streptomyces cadmiisoli]
MSSLVADRPAMIRAIMETAAPVRKPCGPLDPPERFSIFFTE